MDKFYKILNVYERDRETNKLIEGKFSSPTIEGLSRVNWVFTEKIDGTNVRVHWDGYDVIFGGRTDNAIFPKPLQEALDSIFLTDEKRNLFSSTFGGDKVTLFGEGYGPGIQKGGGDYSNEVGFILFDIQEESPDRLWIHPKSRQSIAESLEIDCVPELFTGTLEEGVAFIKTWPQSRVAIKPKTMEGIVGIPEMGHILYGNESPIAVKIKCRDFPK